MSRKSFRDDTAHLDRFFSDTQDTRDTQDTQDTRDTQALKEAKTGYYRLNLKLKAENRDYLARVSWEAHQSITEYLNDLIEADKGKWQTG